MSEPAPYPIAVLVSLDGDQREVRVSDPPPPEYLVARRVPMSVEAATELTEMARANHRRFRLSADRRSTRRWWRVYNDGRSQTPEYAYVYFEIRENIERSYHLPRGGHHR